MHNASELPRPAIGLGPIASAPVWHQPTVAQVVHALAQDQQQGGCHRLRRLIILRSRMTQCYRRQPLKPGFQLLASHSLTHGVHPQLLEQHGVLNDKISAHGLFLARGSQSIPNPVDGLLDLPRCGGVLSEQLRCDMDRSHVQYHMG
ncbi:hypothetical protein [Acidovorax delafieldii]|uniref:hypothetical protein n=1 Tax=Acidovorax delafieldii TaxID=47920 RepID=UPI00375642DF